MPVEEVTCGGLARGKLLDDRKPRWGLAFSAETGTGQNFPLQSGLDLRFLLHLVLPDTTSLAGMRWRSYGKWYPTWIGN